MRGVVMPIYRLVFLDENDEAIAEHVFDDENESSAVLLAYTLAEACSDRCRDFELWRGSRPVRHMDAGIFFSVDKKVLEREEVLRHEIAIRDSRSPVSGSPKLLDRIARLESDLRSKGRRAQSRPSASSAVIAAETADSADDGVVGHPLDLHLGRRLQELRLKRGQSQGKLASQLGVSHQAVQKYESGEIRISASRLYDIATALAVEPRVFFEGFGNAPTIPTLPADGSFDRRTIHRLVTGYYGIRDEGLRRCIHQLVRALGASGDKANGISRELGRHGSDSSLA
jgi:transcriptional regulator with XRE-family HTH domain